MPFSPHTTPSGRGDRTSLSGAAMKPVLVPVPPQGLTTTRTASTARYAEAREGYELPARAESARAARAWVKSTFRRWHVSRHCTDLAVLLVSELATNSIRHAAGPRLHVAAVCAAGHITLSVTDAGSRQPRIYPTAHTPQPDEEHGRGLLLVSTLATAWGSRTAQDGLTVWARLDLKETTP